MRVPNCPAEERGQAVVLVPALAALLITALFALVALGGRLLDAALADAAADAAALAGASGGRSAGAAAAAANGAQLVAFRERGGQVQVEVLRGDARAVATAELRIQRRTVP